MKMHFPGFVAAGKRQALGLMFGTALAFSLASAQSQAQAELVVGAYGGSANKAFEEALNAFAESEGITVRYVPGASIEKASKIVATMANPEYDLVLYDDFAHALASEAGALAKVDPELVPNAATLKPMAKLPNGDGIAVGFYFTGIMYNTEVFAERGWAAPTSWQDLYRPEFCNHLGLASISSSFGMHTLLMLAGGDVDNVPEAIEKMGTLGDCVQTLEISSTKLEEKTQLGEYLVGTGVSTRVPRLAQQGFPVKLVVPEEGTIKALSVTAVVKNSPNEKLAQKAMNWLLEPKWQKRLMEWNFFVPSNPEVPLSDELAGYGLPSADQLDNLIEVDFDQIEANRREWERNLDRALAQ